MALIPAVLLEIFLLYNIYIFNLIKYINLYKEGDINGKLAFSI